MQNTTASQESVFKSEGHRVIFFLTQLSGVSQQEQLGITKEMYTSKTSDQASKWYTNIVKTVNSTECNEELKSTALHKLNYLYKQIRGLA